jgi:phage FluMu protein Com
MDDIRCGQCAKKLAVGQYVQLQIKCPRCGTLNSYSTPSATHLERLRSSNQTMKDDTNANPKNQTKEPRA